MPAKLLALGINNGINFFINTHTFADSKYSLYSAMKSAFVEIARFFAANSQVKVVNMRLEYMYGEGDDYTKFVPFVIKSILEDKEIPATAGEQKRDFIYVQDVVEAYLKALDYLKTDGENFMEFGIGTGKSISIKSYVSKIEEQIGKKANIKWGAVPYGKNEIFDSMAQIETTRKNLKWYPKSDISSGLKKTVDWYKKVIIK